MFVAKKIKMTDSIYGGFKLKKETDAPKRIRLHKVLYNNVSASAA